MEQMLKKLLKNYGKVKNKDSIKLSFFSRSTNNVS